MPAPAEQGRPANPDRPTASGIETHGHRQPDSTARMPRTSAVIAAPDAGGSGSPTGGGPSYRRRGRRGWAGRRDRGRSPSGAGFRRPGGGGSNAAAGSATNTPRQAPHSTSPPRCRRSSSTSAAHVGQRNRTDDMAPP